MNRTGSSEQSRKRDPAVLTVGLIEDDSLMRHYLEEIILSEQRLRFVSAWESAESAVAEMTAPAPDVVLIDLGLPTMSGIECIRALSPKFANTAFLVLTMDESPKMIHDALRAEASGYLLKRATSQEITEGISSAYRGGVPMSPDVAKLVIASFVQTAAQPKLPDLTARQRRILELLAQGLVAKEVAEELGLTYETVRHYLKGIYRKLHVRSRTEAVLAYLGGSS